MIPIMFVSLSLAAAIPIKAQDEKDVEIHKLQTNLRLFDEALSELQAPTPEETALVYAKGVKSRNGAMQYSLLSNKLKAEFRKKMGNEIWVTGVSSPWVSNYKIISKKKASGVHKITIKFNWATSTGSAGSTQEELTIAKENGKWRIININNINQ
jgi:hypothetical protein